jgi:hypothetical protein
MTDGGIPQDRIDAAREALDLVELVGARVALKRRGREYLGLCPFHGERTPSFSVVPAKGFYHCFGCGAHGDALSWLQETEGLSFREAIEKALGAEVAPREVAQRAEQARARQAERERAAEAERREKQLTARELWARGQDPRGTPVERYLESRGLDLGELGGIPPTIRYLPSQKHPEGGRWPVMLAPIQAADRRVVGVHRTYLQHDGRGKAPVSPAKRMLGQAWGGAVRFAPPAATLAIAEGIETALSIRQVRGDLGVWAALSLGNMAGSGLGEGRKHPTRRDDRGRRIALPSVEPDLEASGLQLPEGVETVIFCADADAKDPPSAEALLLRAANRQRADGRLALIARPSAGGDFNDLLKKAAAA